MNPNASITVALKSRDQALFYLQCGNFGRSFAHFLVALQLKPEWRSDLKKEFSSTLCTWGEQLESQKRFKDLFNCYEQAIEIFPENECVLCNLGSHLFSLYAVSAGARDVHACDYSPTMCSIAQEVLEANKMADKVSVINKLSNDLTVPYDLPFRKSLVVTETMDAGLLGEHLLQTLLHAWDQLLFPPHPDLLQALDSEVSSRRHGVVVPFGAKLWAAPVRSRNIARRNYLSGVIGGSWNFNNISLYCDCIEPYDTENLKGSSCEFLAEPVEVFCFDFNNPVELREYYEGKHDEKSVLFRYEGTADAIALWFDVLLDEDITITSSPLSEDVGCWDQAVFRFRKPLPSVSTKVSCSGGKLRFDLFQSDHNNSDRLSSSDGTESEFSISSEAILFMNNKQLQDFIFVSPDFCDKVVNVLELSPFPMLGLRFVQQKNSNLFCVLKTDDEFKAVMEFTRNNGVDASKVKCLKPNELEGLLANMGDEFDLIFNNLFEMSGELKENNVNLIPRLMEVLSPAGVLAPAEVVMMCRPADCPWITAMSRVVNQELTQRYNIAPFINVYQVSQQLDVDLQTIDCDFLSDPVVCLQVNQEDLASDSCRTEDIPVSVAKDGCINALPLWYQYRLFPGQTLPLLSTLDSDSHVNQVVFVVEPPCQVKAGDTVVVNITIQCGIIRLKLIR